MMSKPSLGRQVRTGVPVARSTHSRLRRILPKRWLIFVAALVAVNLIGRWLFPSQIDVTGRRTFTLAPQTRNLLATCRTEVDVVILAPRVPRTPAEQNFQGVAKMVRALVEDYQRVQPLVHLRQFDPDQDAEAAELLRQFAEVVPPCVLVRFPVESSRGHEVLTARDLAEFLPAGPGQEPRLEFLGEQALTAAIARLKHGDQQSPLYVTTGHGELEIQDVRPESRRGGGLLVELLSQLNCRVETLDLTESPRVPHGARAVLIAGWESQWSEEEVAKLETYLRQGGRALVLCGTEYDPRAASLVPSGLEEMLSHYGISLGNDHVVTRNFAGQPEAVSPARPSAVDHPLVRSLPPAPVTLHESRSLRLSTAARKRPGQVIPLLVSYPAPRAWAEGSYLRNATPEPDGPGDTAGPVAMALAVERPHESGATPMLVVVGDAQFLSNRALSGSEGRVNASFALSCVNWLRDRRELMGDIPPRRHEPYRLVGSPEDQRGLVWKSSLILCAVISTAGVSVWVSRRIG